MYLAVLTEASNILNPLRLGSISISTVKESIEEESTVRILERIYPSIFNIEKPLTKSGFMNVFVKETIPLSRIDLSNLNIERVPRSVVVRISGLEILDLSRNTNIRLNEEWFDKLIKNNKILELSLCNCNLTENDLEVIGRIETLERLNISGNKDLNIRTSHFKRILKRLKHLDISDCNLNDQSLNFIFENSENLHSLNYSRNKITNLFNDINKTTSKYLKKSLESLNLSYCSLKSNDIEHIFIFENLREIDLSGNLFSSIELENIQKSSEYYNNPQYCKNKYFEHLKVLKMNYCNIKSFEFILSLFNIEGLEHLSLSENNIGLCLRRLRDFKTKESLKKLVLRNCLIFDEQSFQNLTEFSCLEYLDISENVFLNLSESFTLGKLKDSLIYLDVSDCNWNLNGLNAIIECKKLEYLNASFNHFTSIPEDFNLQELKFTLKELSAENSFLNFNFLKGLTECKYLEKLSLAGNSFFGTPVGFSLNNLTDSLKYLNIERCFLNRECLIAISKCFKLVVLNAQDNDFIGIESDFELGGLRNTLKVVNLNFSLVNHHVLVALTKCTSLKVLHISFSMFKDLPQDFHMEYLKDSLEELHICNTGLSNQHLFAITDCRKLKYLDVSYNDFSEHFQLGASVNTLEYLNLGRCQINYHTLRAISNCKKLRKLEVFRNNFSRIPPDFTLGCAKNSLEEIIIDSSHVNHNGLKAITDCPKLRRLIICLNDFRHIPENFTLGCSKNSLKELDVSFSNINMNGIRAITQCSELISLRYQNFNVRPSFLLSDFVTPEERQD